MGIRLRVRGPAGSETIQTEDDATVATLVQIIKDKLNVRDGFSLKAGFPPAPLDLTASTTPLKDLNLNGETLTLVPREEGQEEGIGSTPHSGSLLSQESGSSRTPQQSAFEPKSVEPDETTMVEWQEGGGYIVLRVMPDDNSCMFTAFGGALGIPDPASRVRNEVAEYILSHPETYTKVVLENIEPVVYASRIRDPQRWGGSIELQCLSEIYDIQICSIDVKYGRVDTYGLDKETRCILMYSGIHYDRIAQTFDPGLPGDLDVTQWKADSDTVLTKAKELAQKLKSANYYTDMAVMPIRCEMPGCENWLGAGEADMVKHTQETGHTAFSEMSLE